MNTREIIDGYFQSTSLQEQSHWSKYVDNGIIFDYEAETGKQLIEMNSDELSELVYRLVSCRDGETKKYMQSHRSYSVVIGELRKVLDWYIVNVTPVANLFSIDKRFRGKTGLEMFSQKYEAFTMEKFQSIMCSVRRDFSEDKADYIELICLLFYSGFPTAKDIAETKAEHINWRTGAALIHGKTVHLTDRALELLSKFYKMEESVSGREKFIILSWHGSALKFFVKQSLANDFQKRELREIISRINAYISIDIGKRYAAGINYKAFYLCGFYDYTCNMYGKTLTDEIINSYYDDEAYDKLKKAALSYGIPAEKVNYLKRDLIIFTKKTGSENTEKREHAEATT